jgi:hypothetical protein
VIGHLLNTTVQVWRAVTSEDGGGGRSTTWAQVGEHRARLSQPTAKDAERGEQSGADLTHVVYLDPGVDVRRWDELRRPGQTLRVVGTVEPSVPIYTRADCAARQPEQEGT